MMAEVEGFDLKGFGERVRTRRKELGLTQPELATKAGVAETAVRRWEENVLPRDADTLARLAVALERSVGWVLGEQQSPAFIDGIRLALDHMRRVAEDDIGRLSNNLSALLIEMRAGYHPGLSAPSERLDASEPVPTAPVVVARTYEEQRAAAKKKTAPPRRARGG